MKKFKDFLAEGLDARDMGEHQIVGPVTRDAQRHFGYLKDVDMKYKALAVDIIMSVIGISLQDLSRLSRSR